MILMFLFIYYIYVSVKEKVSADSLEVGQRWECFYDIDDPFAKPYCQRRVVGLEGYYVLYIQDGGGYAGDTLSHSAYWFRSNSRLIKEQK